MRPAVFTLPLLLLLPAGFASAQAPGSYRGSCTDIRQDGPMLSARCRGGDGSYHETTLNLQACRGQPVANSFGRLTCGNVGGSSRQEGGYRGDYDTAGPGYGYGGPRRYRRHYQSDQNDYGYDAPPPARYAPPPYGDDQND